MIKIENQLGRIVLSQGYFVKLIGEVVRECYGVAGVLENSTVEKLAKKFLLLDNPNKGVSVKSLPGGIVVDIHIAVIYGMNISVIVKSIVHKVKFTIENTTGLTISKVNVFVDSMAT